MRLLLDTHVVLWQQEGNLDRIGSATDTIASAEELLVSVVSFAEVGIKAAIGKLRLPADLRGHVLASGARILGLAPEHGLDLATLPLHHRDPFDRLLIAQARREGLAIVTADPEFTAYDVPVIFAG
ncbi:MAG TPA: type II toxin-antitoxin system VapC family toxin [Solirubrobacteraceae bacterium]|nr:type II toxin-antitoxin system VapC family toxin [Solirubrobacteraceae bacterium]